MIKKVIIMFLSILSLTGCIFDFLKPEEKPDMTFEEREKSFTNSDFVNVAIVPEDLTFKSGVEGFGYYDTLYKTSRDENDNNRYFLKKGFPLLVKELNELGIKPFGKYIVNSTLKGIAAYRNEPNTFGGYYYSTPDNKYLINFYYYYYTPAHEELTITLHNGDSANFQKNIEANIENINDSLKLKDFYNYNALSKRDVLIESAKLLKTRSYAISDIDYSYWGKQTSGPLQNYVYERMFKGYFQLTDHTALQYNMSCSVYEKTNDNTNNYKVPREKVGEYSVTCDYMLNELFELYGIQSQAANANINGENIKDRCTNYLIGQ